MSKPLAIAKSLDHLVLTCASVPATIAWYTRHLGMQHETFHTPPPPPSSSSSSSSSPTSASAVTTQRHALRFGAQKINLHQRGREFEPKAAAALPGTADVCLLVEFPHNNNSNDNDNHLQQGQGQEGHTSGGDGIEATPRDLAGLARAFRARGVEVLDLEEEGGGGGGGVVSRTGARGGQLRSVYVRDPDGNLIE